MNWTKVAQISHKKFGVQEDYDLSKPCLWKSWCFCLQPFNFLFRLPQGIAPSIKVSVLSRSWSNRE
jgi:hypothetical protein